MRNIFSFNAATTQVCITCFFLIVLNFEKQIVPFLTLGLGIDGNYDRKMSNESTSSDMFLLLHNYGGVIESVKRKEIAILLKVQQFCTGLHTDFIVAYPPRSHHNHPITHVRVSIHPWISTFYNSLKNRRIFLNYTNLIIFNFFM